MDKDRRTLLDLILTPGMISVVFQAIHERGSGGWALWGHEGLVRGPRGTNVEAPDVLFDYSRRRRRLQVVELMCLRRVIEESTALPAGLPVFINVTATTLEGVSRLPWLLAGIAHDCGIPTSGMCVELTEQEPIRDRGRIREAVLALRELEVRFAIDDFGNGYGTLELLTAFPPDFVKVGEPLVGGVGKDPSRRQLLRYVLQTVQSLGAAVIAEGVETEDDLAAITDSGVHLAQGYIFSPPAPASRVGRGATTETVLNTGQ